MRIVFFAKRHKRSGITGHMQRALESSGHEVLRINRKKVERLVGKRLAWWHIRRKIERFRPDVVLVFTFDLPAAKLQELRAHTRTATFFDDCPPELDDRVKGAVAASDAFFITNRGQIELYRAETGAEVAYVTGGCDPVDHVRVPPQPDYVSDVAFIGKADPRGERIPVLEELAKHFDVKVYGPQWREVANMEPARDDIYPEQYPIVCNSARVVIGCDLRHDVDIYFSNRTWLSLGCGAFLCTRYVPNLEEVLTDGEHCAFWRSPEHAVEVVGRYLADDDARARIAQAGFEYAHKEYSYARMLERMLAHPALQPADAKQ
jgi:Glycosyl transferases group 1